jgi:hypothetical protein
MAHAKIFAIALIFGAIAYGTTHILILASRAFGLLDWL